MATTAWIPILLNPNYDYSRTGGVVKEKFPYERQNYSAYLEKETIYTYRHTLTFKDANNQPITAFNQIYNAVIVDIFGRPIVNYNNNNGLIFAQLFYNATFPQNAGIVTVSLRIDITTIVCQGYYDDGTDQTNASIELYWGPCRPKDYDPIIKTFQYDSGAMPVQDCQPGYTWNGTTCAKDETDVVVNEPPTNFSVDFSTDKTSGIIGDVFTATPSISGISFGRIKSLRWSTSESAPAPANGIPVSSAKKEFSFTSNGSKNITLEMTSDEDIVRTKTRNIAINTIAEEEDSDANAEYITSQMKVVVKYTAAQTEFVGLNSSYDYNNNLFDALVASSDRPIYFAPRGWSEAGLVVDFFKETFDGQPAIAIIVERRVTSIKTGMESIEYTKLPTPEYENFQEEKVGTTYVRKPRGCLFTTANDLSVDCFLLSSPESKSVVEDMAGTSIVKEAIDKHPVIVFSQGSNPEFNALGDTGENTNFDWSSSPFTPFMSVLRKDQYSASTDALFLSGFDRFPSVGLSEIDAEYNNILNYRTEPFNNNYLRVRAFQNKETSELLTDDPNLFNEKLATSPWGKSDAPAAGANLVSYHYTGANDDNPEPLPVAGVDLTWADAGMLFRPATAGPEVPIVWNKTTAPYWGGAAFSAIEKRSLHVFESYDTIYKSGTDVFSVSQIGAPLYFAINYKTEIFDYPEIINNVNDLRMVNLPPSKKRMIFSDGNKFYIFNTSDGSLVEDNGIVFTSVNISENIINLQKTGEISVSWNGIGGLTQSGQNLGLFNNSPLASEYFAGEKVLINFEDQEFKIAHGEIKGNNTIETNWTSLVDQTKPAKIVLYGGHVYFSTRSGFGILSHESNRIFYYQIDTETGNIEEEFDNNRTTSVFKEAIDSVGNSVSVVLLPTNTEQKITLGGMINDIPFASNLSVKMCNFARPTVPTVKNGKTTSSNINSNNNLSVFINGTDLSFVENGSLLPVAMNTEDDYKAYFQTASNEMSGTNSLSVRSSKLINAIANSGNYQFTIGLASDGTTNWNQNSVAEMHNKFSTDIVILKDEDVNISVRNIVERNEKSYLNGDDIRVSLAINSIANFQMPVSITYDVLKQTTTMRFSEPWMPESITELESQFPGYNHFDRLRNCLVVTKKGTHKILSAKNIAGQDVLVVGGNAANSSGEYAAVTAFAPNKATVNETMRGGRTPASIHVKEINSVTGQIIFQDIVLPVEIADNNSVDVVIFEDGGLIYSKKIDVVFPETSSSKSQYINITYHANYDEVSKVFYNTFGYGNGSDSDINQLVALGHTKFYAKISSTSPIDLTEEIKMEFLDNMGNAVFDSPYLLNEENVVGGDDKVLMTEVNISPAVKSIPNMNILVKFTATTANGQKILF